MTEIQKQQFAKIYLAPLSILSLFLVALFVWAIKGARDQNFFVLFIGLAIVLIFLFFQQKKILAKNSFITLQTEDLKENINLLNVQIEKENEAIQSFQEKIIDYSQLKGLTERLALCLTLEDTLKNLTQAVNKLFPDTETTVIVYLFHAKTGELGLSFSQKDQEQINLKEKRGDFFDRWLMKNMQPLLIEDTHSDYRFDNEKIKTQSTREIRSLMSVPLIVGNKAVGILRLDHPAGHHYNTQDLRFLKTIGDVGAVAVENAQLYEHVEQLAIKDSLTGLYLRRYLQERLPEEISRQMRYKNELSFLMIDLDHFKKYNDTFGHVAGDIVLKTVSMILEDMFGAPGNIICRYGGEEFSVLLSDCPKTKAKEWAESLRKRVEEQPILLRREETKVTISIGVASFPKDAGGRDELIHKADKALYQAKAQGRNCVVMAS